MTSCFPKSSAQKRNTPLFIFGPKCCAFSLKASNLMWMTPLIPISSWISRLRRRSRIRLGKRKTKVPSFTPIRMKCRTRTRIFKKRSDFWKSPNPTYKLTITTAASEPIQRARTGNPVDFFILKFYILSWFKWIWIRFDNHLNVQQILQLEVVGSTERSDGSSDPRELAFRRKPGHGQLELQAQRLRLVPPLLHLVHQVHRSVQETRRLLRPNGAPLEAHSLERNAREHHGPPRGGQVRTRQI